MMYWYKYRLRGLSLGCQPDDFIKHDPTIGKFGAVAYDRELTKDELQSYELEPLDEQMIAKELGYYSNTQTPTLFQKEIEKFWEDEGA